MSLSPGQITIAITVYSRRQYIERAVESALNQTVPVKVIVVEDCGPDEKLQDFVLKRFGSRIEYFKNIQRRGLFDNWNACMEYCQTPWLSILHDDDFLAPNFIEEMLKLYSHLPGCGLYFGKTQITNETISTFVETSLPHPRWRKVELTDGVRGTPFLFPGHLFRIDCAKAVGGFRKTSFFCGDWEMWMKLIAHAGAGQTSATVSFAFEHKGWDRGTNVVVRTGRLYPLNYVQYKRNLALLRKKGIRLELDRQSYQKEHPVPSQFLLRYGSELPPRRLNYHIRLLLISESPHWRHRTFKTMVGILGKPFVWGVSCLWNLPQRGRKFAKRV